MLFVKEIKFNKNSKEENKKYFKDVIKDLLNKSEKDEIFLDSKLNKKQLQLLDSLYEEMGQVFPEEEIDDRIKDMTIEEGIKILLNNYNIDEIVFLEIVSSYSIYSTFNERVIKKE